MTLKDLQNVYFEYVYKQFQHSVPSAVMLLLYGSLH